MAGGGVIVRIFEGRAPEVDAVLVCFCLCFLSGSSQQPKKKPGVSQTSEGVGAVEGLWWPVVVVSQLPRNQPGLQVVEAGTELVLEVEVLGGSVVVVTVTFASSLQPNQPGVTQDVVVYVVVMTGWVEVVVSSKQPHQPGVLQVVVRV